MMLKTLIELEVAGDKILLPNDNRVLLLTTSFNISATIHIAKKSNTRPGVSPACSTALQAHAQCLTCVL